MLADSANAFSFNEVFFEHHHLQSVPRAVNFWELLGVKNQKLSFGPSTFLGLTSKKQNKTKQKKKKMTNKNQKKKTKQKQKQNKKQIKNKTKQKNKNKNKNWNWNWNWNWN